MLKFISPLFISTASLLGIMVIADATSSPNINQQSSKSETVLLNADHHHGIRDVSNLPKVPSLSLQAKEDIFANGWNIQLVTENFRFSPENANKGNINNEGHAHLYVDGKKVSRVYSHWNYVFNLTPGPHTISVSLNSNDHDILTLGETRIEASVDIVQKYPHDLSQAN